MVNNSGALGGSFDLHVWAKWLRRTYDLKTGKPRIPNPLSIDPLGRVTELTSVKCSANGCGRDFDMPTHNVESIRTKWGNTAHFYCPTHRRNN